MLDLSALGTLGLLAFFGFLIWSTVIKPEKKPVAPAAAPKVPAPGPVGLCCLSCYATVRVVEHQEYMEIARAGRKIYCGRCLAAIETYKAQQERSR